MALRCIHLQGHRDTLILIYMFKIVTNLSLAKFTVRLDCVKKNRALVPYTVMLGKKVSFDLRL